MLQAFAPYLSAELWSQMAEDTPLLRAPWPGYDESLAAEHFAGSGADQWQLRSVVSVPAGSDGTFARDRMEDPKIEAALVAKES